MAEGRMNLAALQQRDPYITDIVDTATQVALYNFSPKANEWVGMLRCHFLSRISSLSICKRWRSKMKVEIYAQSATDLENMRVTGKLIVIAADQ